MQNEQVPNEPPAIMASCFFILKDLPRKRLTGEGIPIAVAICLVPLERGAL